MNMNEFYCVKCGRKGLPVWRKPGAEREAGHLKKLFCIYCNQEVNHVEVKPFTKYSYEDFKCEYEYCNFNEKGIRIRPYGKLKEMINNGEIEKQKTLFDVWDSGIR